MNIKVQLGKNIHKLPTELRSFSELISSIRQILSKKLPEHYTFKYQKADNALVCLESEYDFNSALSYLKENNIHNLKVQVVKENKPFLDLYVVHPDFCLVSGSAISNHEATGNQEIKNALPSLDSEIREANMEQMIDQGDSKRDEKPLINQVSVESLEKASMNQQTVNEVKDLDNFQGQQSKVIMTQPANTTQRILKIGSLQQNYNNQESKSAVEKECNQLSTKQNKQEQQQSEVSKEKMAEENTFNVKKDPLVIKSRSLSDSKLPQTLEELHQMIEEMVEEKLKQILDNYELIPKNPKLDNQEKKSSINKVNINDEEECKEEIKVSPSIQIQKNASVSDKFVEGDQKKLRAILKTDPESEIYADSGRPYVQSFQLQNSGSQSWPVNTFFQCLEGPNENQKIEVGAVQPSKQFAIMLPLDAPFNPDKYPEIWSLVYETEERQTVTFGPKVRYTLIVSPVVRKPEIIVNPSKPSTSMFVDQMKQLDANNKILELAKKMKDILGGDLKKYVEFLSQSDFSQLSPDIAILTYLENQKF